jgi:hypothetical protein
MGGDLSPEGGHEKLRKGFVTGLFACLQVRRPGCDRLLVHSQGQDQAWLDAHADHPALLLRGEAGPPGMSSILLNINFIACSPAPAPRHKSSGGGSSARNEIKHRWQLYRHRGALHRTALHCTALHCTVLHCTALHCTAQH